MAKRTKAQLKNFFQTGAIPTASQFADLIDSMNPPLSEQVSIGLSVHKDSENNIDGYNLNLGAVPINYSRVTGNTYETPGDVYQELANSGVAINSALRPGMVMSFNNAQNITLTYLLVNRNEFLMFGGTRGWIIIGDTVPVNLADHTSYIDAYIDPYNANTIHIGNDEYICSDFIPFDPETEILKFKGTVKGLDGNDVTYIGLYQTKDLAHASSNYYLISSPDPTNVENVLDLRSQSLYHKFKYIRFCTLKDYDYSLILYKKSTNKFAVDKIYELENKVAKLENYLPNSGVVSYWDAKTDNPDMLRLEGDLSILDDWDFYLIDEQGDNTKVLGKLRKDNIFRFKDTNSYAPVMVIPQDQPINNPWETHEKYAIVRAWNHNIYLLDDKDKDGNIMRGLFKYPVTVDGKIPRLLEKTGISADVPTFDNYDDPQIRCTLYSSSYPFDGGSRGQFNILEDFVDASYPFTESYEYIRELIRGKNTNHGSTKVFSEIMGVQRLSHIIAAQIKYGTRYLHNPYLFGKGLYHNDVVNEDNWGSVSGVRWSLDDGLVWNYDNLVFVNADPQLLTPDGWRIAQWAPFISSQKNFFKTLEVQAALSYASNWHIGPDEDFEFDGQVYYYKNIPGTQTLRQGSMNAQLFKKYNTRFEAQQNELTVTVDLEVIFQIPVVDGYIFWGRLSEFCWSGMEAVTQLNGGQLDVFRYLCTNQLDLIPATEETGNLDSMGMGMEMNERPAIMGKYDLVATGGSQYSSRARVLSPFSYKAEETNYDLYLGECAKTPDLYKHSTYYPLNNYKFVIWRLIGNAIYGEEYSARSLNSNSGSGGIGMSYQIRLVDLVES